MRFSSSLIALVAFLGQAFAHPSNLIQRDTGLEVKISRVGNTLVKATITNTAKHEISFVKINTPFGNGPVHKAQVMKNGVPVQFTGVCAYYNVNNLPPEAFQVLAAGASAEATFDVAETADLSAGGSYSIKSAGTISIVDRTSRTAGVTEAVEYSSNELTINVDGAEAAKVKSATEKLNKRTQLQPSCSSRDRRIMEAAIRLGGRYAQAAARAASSGSARKFQEYFKTTDSRTRQQVAQRFSSIAREHTTSGGRTKYHCRDPIGFCLQNPGTIAYTHVFNNVVANCDRFYDNVPAVVNSGHDTDHGHVTVHEFAHASAVVNPHTRDHAYGYASSTRLSARLAFNNADNYALFATDVARNGGGGGGNGGNDGDEE
ncbi:hypothetical protein LOZ51_004535 [Ophidiomyces ophidiicola]|nr:hypothetical protein LOZ55_002571 [Ophidiomyces ophidiicola]KAI1991945.1 hypothetical protein LOZ51_004535 [Ophidiomyces ophidiicola]